MPRPASPLGQGWCLLRWLLRMLSIEPNFVNTRSTCAHSARAAPTQQRAAVLERSPRFRKLHAGFAIFERYLTFCRATFAPKPGHVAASSRAEVFWPPSLVPRRAIADFSAPLHYTFSEELGAILNAVVQAFRCRIATTTLRSSQFYTVAFCDMN